MKIDINTKILGLIGYPLGHSISPLLHNYSLEKLDLNYVYLAFALEPDSIQKGLEGLTALNFRGINVTIPHKNRVIPYLDELDPLAQKIGAVNTIVNDNNKLQGYNTDAAGFKRMLEDDGNFIISGKKAAVIGAGGASRAVGVVLCHSGISELYVINRTYDKARKLVRTWQQFYENIKIEAVPMEIAEYQPLIKKMDLIVDTTPVGMSPETDVEPVIAAHTLHAGQLVVDLVYNPPETTLMKAARSQGAQTLNGLDMLLYQGIEAFKLWTGQEPDVDDWRELASANIQENAINETHN